ncbi:MAG: pre-peptidase C-terminal domain-containing protein [Acidobacteria bacterium]|nr:pre-peptidase C-terminal domain-containing protein [Acidobacteriota bacterium]
MNQSILILLLAAVASPIPAWPGDENREKLYTESEIDSGSSVRADKTLLAESLASPAASRKADWATHQYDAGSDPHMAVSLTSGVTTNFALPAVTVPTLMNITGAFQIIVPPGATRLDIRVVTTSLGDVDLYVRYGVPPDVVGSSVVADYRSITTGPNESVTISPPSVGTYYITLAQFSTGVVSVGTITATVVTGTPPPPPPAGNPTVLVSGVAANFSLPAVSGPTLMTISGAYQIAVPAGATRLDIQVVTSTPGADVDLYVRFGSPPAVVNGSTQYDYRSVQAGGNEVVTVGPGSSPPLQAGTYYVTLAMQTAGVAAAGTVTATVTSTTTPPPTTGGGTVLTSGTPASFSLPAVTTPTLMTISGAFQINVPAGATVLDIRVTTTTPGADVDLYVRAGRPPEIVNGAAQFDFKSDQVGGNESIVITAASRPPLQQGTYFITLGLYSTGTPAQGTVTATITGGVGAGPSLDSFLNGAGLQRRWISPGSIATIVAPGVAAGIQGCVTPGAPFGPLPTLLATVSVSFGGVPAPVYSVCNNSGQQSVTVQVPLELIPGPVPVSMRSAGTAVSWPAVPLLEVSPGLYETQMSDGARRAILLRPDNSFVSLENRARKGEVVRVFVVGLGPVAPAVSTNRAGGREAVSLPIVMGVNNAGVDPLYAVYAANMIGVYEVALEIPLDTPSGSDIPFVVAVRVASGLVFSNASSIPVQ